MNQTVRDADIDIDLLLFVRVENVFSTNAESFSYTYLNEGGNENTGEPAPGFTRAGTFDPRRETRDIRLSTLFDGSDLNPQTSNSLFTTNRKARDTRLGGNEAINSYYQYNEDDDIAYPINYGHELQNINSKRRPSGMGRVYSKDIDDNQQVLHITCGVLDYPQSLIRFLGSSISPGMVAVNQEGRKGLLRRGAIAAAATAGYLFSLALTLPLLPFIYGAKFIGRVLDFGNTKFSIDGYATLRPEMPLYYRYVNAIITKIAVNINLIPYELTRQEAIDRHLPYSLQNAGFDIYSIILRRHRYEDEASGIEGVRYRTSEEVFLDDTDRRDNTGEGAEDNPGRLQATSVEWSDDNLGLGIADHTSGVAPPPIDVSALDSDEEAENARERAIQQGGTQQPDEDDGGFLSSLASGVYESISSGLFRRDWRRIVDGYKFWSAFIPDTIDGFSDAAANAIRGGDVFVGFKLEKSSNANESFSNSAGEIPIKSVVNGVGSTIKSLHESTAGFNTGLQVDKLAAYIGDVGSAFIANASKSIGAIINLLKGGTFVNFPEIWQGSDASTSYSFNMRLRAPYGNNVSIYTDLFVPLSMMLAASLPRSTGPHSYTNPFYVRAYARGMFSIPLGMIDNLSITRGDEQFGWTIDRLPTKLELSFSVKDLSPLLFMNVPLTISNYWDALTGGADTSFNEYLNTLGGLTIEERLRFLSKFNRANRLLSEIFFSQILNGASLGTRIGNNLGIFGAIYSNTGLPGNNRYAQSPFRLN